MNFKYNIILLKIIWLFIFYLMYKRAQHMKFWKRRYLLSLSMIDVLIDILWLIIKTFNEIWK